MTAPGRRAEERARRGALGGAGEGQGRASWLGSPPVRLRRTATAADDSADLPPPRRLKVARGAVELCRIVPVMCTVAIAVSVLLALDALATLVGSGVAAPSWRGGGPARRGRGRGQCDVAKWLLVGRIRAGEHPLWSSFVWRNEVADTFVEMVAAPWFARTATGTPA